MAITTDPRPHVIGDLVIVTGTFADGDTITAALFNNASIWPKWFIE